MILQEKLSLLGFCLVWLILANTALAYNKEEPITIDADNVNYEYKKRVVLYKGHVHAIQGISELNADELIISYEPNNKIKEVRAKGNLAQYKTLVHEGKDTLVASATTIIYYPLNKKVILQEKAQVNYNNSVVNGSYITYDIEKQAISSQARTDSQTRIVLEPTKDLKNK